MNKLFTVVLVSSAIALLPACGSRKKVEPVVVAPMQQEEVVVELERVSGPLAAEGIVWQEEDMK